VLKRLSASDLTLFETHFRATAGTKQKAINLDAFVFEQQFYPGIAGSFGPAPKRVGVNLEIFGPNGASIHNLQRKILKQQKNWRLNGEWIGNPVEEPNRYDTLVKNDFALMEFTGAVKPETVRIQLISQNSEFDVDAYNSLSKVFGAQFGPRTGMIACTFPSLEDALSNINLNEDHSLNGFLDEKLLEEVAQGVEAGIEQLLHKRKGRPISREELGSAKSRAEELGYRGEELVNSYFESLKDSIPNFTHEWTSEKNAIAPYDFIAHFLEGSRKLDVKSTSGDFSGRIHISIAELIEMTKEDMPYDIFRIYKLESETPKMKIAQDMKKFAQDLISKLDLPEGVKIDGVSVKPEVLNFGNEIVLTAENE
jgi:hypothetical protein